MYHIPNQFKAFSVGPQPKIFQKDIDYHIDPVTEKLVVHPRESQITRHPAPVFRPAANGHRIRAQRQGKKGTRITSRPLVTA